MQRKSKLSKIFWKISYNNQNNNNILGKKKISWHSFWTIHVQKKYIKKQRIRNQNLSQSRCKIKRNVRHILKSEYWKIGIVGLPPLIAICIFSAIFFFPFFSPLLLHPFYMVHAAWKSSFVPVVIDEFGKCTMATMAQHEIGNWALEPPPSSASQTSAISLWGDEIPAEVVKPLNSKSIKVDGK